VNETRPIKSAYRARYVGIKRKFGTLGDPAAGTVSE
jgi:hypothetical protein